MQSPDIRESFELNITENLSAFRKANEFQKGLISFMANLQTSSEELNEIKNLFCKLDINHDGFITIDELKLGLGKIQAYKHMQGLDWEELMEKMDTNKDGKIDYTEFIAAAFDRSKLLNR